VEKTDTAERVLIVEDETATRVGLTELVSAWGFLTDEAADGEAALQKVTTFRPAIIVSDLVMPRMDGLQLLRALKDQLTDISIIILTAQGTVETAVEAIKEGAFDYLTKPVDTQRLRILLDKAVERQETLREVKELRRQLRDQGSYGRIVGNSPGIRGIYRVIEQAAPTNASVLVWGESGTGKGTGRADDSLAQPARVVSLRRDQLRRDPGDAARERDLRAREGRVHGRAGSPPRLFRARAPRHAVPGRDLGDDARHASQAAARSAGTVVPAAGRPPGDLRGRSRHRGHQSESRGCRS
jgi:CheY-like chemotaxis protein